MHYTYLALTGFKRFMLNDIQSFSMTIANPLQLILGSNGAGKSSLLQQLTPLPPSHTDFTKQGSKELHLTHHQHQYVLKSHFNPAQKHSFIQDGLELNEGGTITVQKELVKTHFGILPETHTLILGEEHFTAMSPMRRKEWFITLCETNYDYAIRVYNKLRERLRDTQGALKLAKKRLVTETEKQLKTEEEAKLKQEVQSLHDLLTHLLEYRKPVENDLDMLQVQQVQDDNLLTKLSVQTLSLLKTLGGNRALTETSLQTILSRLQHRLTQEQTLLQKVSEDYVDNDNKIKVLQQAEQQTLESLQAEILQLQCEQQRFVQSKLLFELDVFDARSALNAFLSIKSSLMELFSTIPSNETKKYSTEQLQQARDRLTQSRIQYQKLIEKIQALTSKHKHMLEHRDKPDLTCTRCQHRFSIHYNEAQFQQLETELEHSQCKLEQELRPQIQALETYIEDCGQYARLYRQYQQTLQHVPILQPYWTYLAQKQVLLLNPSAGITELQRIEQDLRHQLQYAERQQQIQQKQQLLHSLKDVGTADLKSLIQQNQQYNQRIETHTAQIQKLTQRQSYYQTLLTLTKDLQTLLSRIEKGIAHKTDLLSEEYETLRRHSLNDCIRQLQSVLAGKEHILTQSQMQQSVINNISFQITEMELEEQALQALVKTLSPSEGLIAEGLFGFIKAFISQMNQFICKVWSYPLSIEACQLDEDQSVELDYKFPLVQDHHRLPDVKFGSKGMQEIVNLAFRVTAMKYLGLQNSALLLDEPGTSFDTEHRRAFIDLVKALYEQQCFKQIFLISHYSHQYDALSNADICVLSEHNILKPVKYNEHVRIN